MLLVEIADVESMRPRQIELAFRVALRFASSTQLGVQRPDCARFAIVPSGANRPVLISRLARVPDNVLYMDTSNCMLALGALFIPDSNEEERDADRLFGNEFTTGERFEIVRRLQLHWGERPPERRERRNATNLPEIGRAHV